jgi:hypothetical protein
VTSCNVIDLFAGAGGLGIGAMRAGCDLRLSVDNEPWSCRTLEANTGEHGARVLKAPWDAFDGERLTIGAARTKRSAARTRVLDVDRATAQTLREWRLEAGRPAGSTPIIGEMTANALKLWGVRRLRPQVKAATGGRIDDAVVYALRHSHASALHYTTRTLPAILRRMGHGAQAHFRHYAHLIDAIPEGQRYADLEALYDAARDENRRRTPGAHQLRSADR